MKTSILFISLVMSASAGAMQPEQPEVIVISGGSGDFRCRVDCIITNEKTMELIGLDPVAGRGASPIRAYNKAVELCMGMAAMSRTLPAKGIAAQDVSVETIGGKATVARFQPVLNLEDCR